MKIPDKIKDDGLIFNLDTVIWAKSIEKINFQNNLVQK